MRIYGMLIVPLWSNLTQVIKVSACPCLRDANPMYATTRHWWTGRLKSAWRSDAGSPSKTDVVSVLPGKGWYDDNRGNTVITGYISHYLCHQRRLCTIGLGHSARFRPVCGVTESFFCSNTSNRTRDYLVLALATNFNSNKLEDLSVTYLNSNMVTTVHSWHMWVNIKLLITCSNRNLKIRVELWYDTFYTIFKIRETYDFVLMWQ